MPGGRVACGLAAAALFLCVCRARSAHSLPPPLHRFPNRLPTGFRHLPSALGWRGLIIASGLRWASLQAGQERQHATPLCIEAREFGFEALPCINLNIDRHLIHIIRG